MEDEQKIVKLEAPEKPEVPEEGFVPYCAETAPDPARKTKRRVIILLILALLVLAVFLISFIGKKQNFYSKTLYNLQFDYRGGETVTEDSSVKQGACSEALSEKLSGKSYSFDASMYMFNESGKVLDLVTEYDYQHTPAKDTVRSCSGTAGSLVKKKITEEISLGAATNSETSRSLLLKEFFFGIRAHDVFTFECYDTYRSEVGSKAYTCEIWLMSDRRAAQPVYYTLYRYYAGAELAGVRVLNDRNTVMEVYDIKKISVG